MVFVRKGLNCARISKVVSKLSRSFKLMLGLAWGPIKDYTYFLYKKPVKEHSTENFLILL